MKVSNGFLLCALVCPTVACSDWAEGMGAPDDVVGVFEDGTYTGPIVVEARAFVGPVRVSRGECEETVDLRVKSQAKNPVKGKVTCDFGDDIGIVTVDIVGDIAADGSVNGAVLTDLFDANWDGWFHGDNELYAETFGETKTQGVRIEYSAWFDVALR